MNPAHASVLHKEFTTMDAIMAPLHNGILQSSVIYNTSLSSTLADLINFVIFENLKVLNNMLAQHRVPSPCSQLPADEEAQSDLTEVLQWTTEDIFANLPGKDKILLLDGVLENMEALETLSDVEIDLDDETADILNQPVWMDAKLYSLEASSVQSQHGHLNITQLSPGLNYNLASNGVYTPPQTPPYGQEQQYQQVNINIAYQHQSLTYTENELVIPLEFQVCSAQPDVARELAVVDELVRTTANSFEPVTCSGPTSPTASWISSLSSSGDHSGNSSANSSCGESSTEDSEWRSSTSLKKTTQRGRKRSKPYSTDDYYNNLDKKSRKKEQNKNAATRYRMKKKAEVAEIQSEEHDLESAKHAHEAKIVDLEREISVIKGLMKEFFLKQGLIH